MGQGEGKLTTADVTLAVQISNEIPSGIANTGKVKKVLAQYKAIAKEKGEDQEIRSVAEFQKILEKLHFFKQQVAAFSESVKPALKGHPICLKAFNVAFTKLAESPDFKESQSQVLFKAFDKDGSGTINLKEFLSGFLIASSGNAAEDARLRFDAYDIDGNGTLSKEEVAKMYKECYESSLKVGKVLAAAMVASAISQQSSVFGEVRIAKLLLSRVLDVISKYLDKQTNNLMKRIDEIVEKIFTLADQDKNGVLNRDEYVTYATDPEITTTLNKFTVSLEDPAIHAEMAQEIKEKTVYWILEFSGLTKEQIDEAAPALIAKMNETN